MRETPYTGGRDRGSWGELRYVIVIHYSDKSVFSFANLYLILCYRDIGMSCPAKNAAQQLTLDPNRKNSVHLYHFEHKTGDSNYVPHTAELNYVFHDFLILKTTNDREMADAMSTYWGNFLVDPSHDPNSDVVGMSAVPEWPAYNPNLDNSISMTDTVADSEVVTGLKKKECQLAIRQIDDYVQAYYPPI